MISTVSKGAATHMTVNVRQYKWLVNMGSYGQFTLILCDNCDACEVPPRYPGQWFRICAGCLQTRRHNYIYVPLCRSLGIESQAGRLQSYVEDSYQREKRAYRKWYLWCVLMSADSCFRRFTSYTNGSYGNISSQEAILDRIMMFV